MKKHLFIALLLVAGLVGCDNVLAPKNNAEQFYELTPPIILVAESADGDVTVCDSKGKYVSLHEDYVLAHTISDSYQKGDTILFLNKQ